MNKYCFLILFCSLNAHSEEIVTLESAIGNSPNLSEEDMLHIREHINDLTYIKANKELYN